MESALKAVARVVSVDINQAMKFSRRQPLFNEEIHIEEELINLEEAIKSFHIAYPTLKKYPHMRRNAIRERRQIITHRIGMAARMLRGRPLPRDYTERDTEFVIHKLVNLVVGDAQAVGYRIDDYSFEKMKPHLSFRLKFATGSLSLNPSPYLRSAMQKLL